MLRIRSLKEKLPNCTFQLKKSGQEEAFSFLCLEYINLRLLFTLAFLPTKEDTQVNKSE